MSVIADFAVPADEFVLHHTLDEVPDVRIDVERVVAHTEESVTPYFRVWGVGFDGVEDALDADPSVEDVSLLEEAEGERFYRANWSVNTESLVDALEGGETAIVSAATANGRWECRLLFPDRERLSAFDARCRARDLSFDLVRTFSPDNPETFGQYELTHEQRDVLVAAVEAGYFAVPRETSLDALADQFDVSAQAVSARLRRGLANVLTNTVAPEE